MDSNPKSLQASHKDVTGIHIKGSDTVYLCLHGFSATPQTFSELASYIHMQTQASVYAPLLPGHGTVASDLDHVTHADWIHFAQQQIIHISKMYKHVHLVGFSLGGSLCILSQKIFPNNIQTLHLLAPGVFLTNKKHALALYLAQYFPTSWLKKYIRQKEDVTKGHISYQYYSYYAASQVFQTLRKVQKSMTEIHIPTCIQVPPKDPVIDPTSAHWIKSHCTHPSSKLLEIGGGQHIMLNCSDKEKISQNIITFVQNAL